MEKIYMVADRIEDITYQGELKGKKVTDKEGHSVNVKGGKKGSGLYERWDELIPECAYEFTMDEYNGKPFVADFQSVEVALAEQEMEKAPKPPKPLPTATPAPQVEISGAEMGMTIKEVRELYTMGKLNQLFGPEIAAGLMAWYRGKILSTSRMPYDGKDLPPAKG